MQANASSPEIREALVNSFLTNIPDNVYFKDAESRFIAVSDSFARYIGLYDPAAIVGKTDFDLFDDNHAQPAFDDEQRIMRTGEPIVGKLEKEVWPDGRVTWVMTSKMPLRTADGRTVGTFGISQDVTASKQVEDQLETARKEVMDAARLAGMAEVATGVLHNVGNVLTSLNVSNTVVGNGLREFKAESLLKVVTLLEEHAANLGEFLTQDPKGRLIPAFLGSFARHLATERGRLLNEVESQQQNIDHIKDIVSMQQSYATMAGIVERLSPEALMEDALRMNAGALSRHRVTVVREFSPAPPILAERGKVLQILVNLIRNGKYALDEGGSSDKRLTMGIEAAGPDKVRFIVKDNGVGIPAGNLPKIFVHGFTTRANGHGFGLHSSALAAKEMHGTLRAFSDGPGKGAAFVVELPVAEPAPVECAPAFEGAAI
ncbi:MAG: PAS domain-containing protein [Opitutaceae bacterium]